MALYLRPSRRLLPLLVTPLLGLFGCQSSPDSAGTVARLSPAPFRVAVAPLARWNQGLAMTEEQIGLAVDSRGTFQERFAAALRAEGVASDVIQLQSEEDVELLAEAARQQADLLIRPRLRSALFDESTLSDRWLLSGGLWLLTWAGGLFVDDSTYATNLALDLEIIDVRRGGLIQQTSAASGNVDLDFFDRNDFFSLGTLVSFLLPPFWTPDSVDKTSESLTAAAIDQLAVEVKSKLTDTRLERELKARHCQLKLAQGINGAPLGSIPTLRGTLESQQSAIAAVFLSVNGKPWEQKVEVTPEAEQDRNGQSFASDLNVPLAGLARMAGATGPVFLRIEVSLEDGAEFSYTLVFSRPEPAA